MFPSAFIDEKLRVILLCEVISRLLVKDGNTLGVEELAPVKPSLEMGGPGYHHITDVRESSAGTGIHSDGPNVGCILGLAVPQG